MRSCRGVTARTCFFSTDGQGAIKEETASGQVCRWTHLRNHRPEVPARESYDRGPERHTSRRGALTTCPSTSLLSMRSCRDVAARICFFSTDMGREPSQSLLSLPRKEKCRSKSLMILPQTRQSRRVHRMTLKTRSPSMCSASGNFNHDGGFTCPPPGLAEHYDLAGDQAEAEFCEARTLETAKGLLLAWQQGGTDVADCMRV